MNTLTTTTCTTHMNSGNHKGEHTVSRASLIISLLLGIVPLTALAQPKMELQTRAEKEITVEENGRQVTRRVPADKIESGAELIYTVSYKNTGSEKATNVVVNNPVPEHTRYIPDSAFGKNTEITFSLDGKQFRKPDQLTYTVTTAGGQQEQHPAKPEQFTHIRWRIAEVMPGAGGEVGFRVKVK